MKFNIFTIFPEMFPGPLGHSLAGKALEAGLWSYETINIRDYAEDKHKTVDDTPFGGGAGMVMRPDVLGKAIEANTTVASKIIYMSPRGKMLNQQKSYELLKNKEISIICGRFEGIDERVIEEYNIEEISIGDYILSGGEIAAITLMDSCIRLIDGVIGNNLTLNEESFGQNADYAGLLEYPLYTRPSKWKNRHVPEVLLSGNHAKINQWRLLQSQEITKERRNDLWETYILKGNKND